MERVWTFYFSFNCICYILVFYSYRSKTSTHMKMNLVLLKILREVWLAFSSCSCTLVVFVRYCAISGMIIIGETDRAHSDLKSSAEAPTGFRGDEVWQKPALWLFLRLEMKRQSGDASKVTASSLKNWLNPFDFKYASQFSRMWMENNLNSQWIPEFNSMEKLILSGTKYPYKVCSGLATTIQPTLRRQILHFSMWTKLKFNSNSWVQCQLPIFFLTYCLN